MPLDLLVAVGEPLRVDARPVLGLGHVLVVDLVGALLGRLHDFPREVAQLGAAGDQLAQRGRVDVVVLGHHPVVRGVAGGLENRLVVLRQVVPLLQVDQRHQLRSRFPPARGVVVLADLLEAELRVVVGSDPLAAVDRALLQRGIDVGAGHHRRHDAGLRKHLAAETADAETQPLQVLEGVDLLAEPAAHLGAGVAREDRLDAVFGEQRLHDFLAAAEQPPGVGLAEVHAERYAGAEGEAQVLAGVVVGRGVAELDGAVLRRVQDLQPGDEFTPGESADREVAVGHVADRLGDLIRAAEDGVEALGPARRHAPVDLGIRLRDCRRGDTAGRGAYRRFLEKRTTLHNSPPG